jgi:hypothetical protein
MKTCNYCGHQNDDTATTCSGCGEPLNNPAETDTAADLRDTTLNPVIVATFENTEHAGVLRAELEAAGIEAWIPEDFSFEFPPQTASVQVAAKDAVAAGEIAAEFRKVTLAQLHPPATRQPDPAQLSIRGPVPDTNKCVSCGAPIPSGATLCPKCAPAEARG